jgi:hypothetical protein
LCYLGSYSETLKQTTQKDEFIIWVNSLLNEFYTEPREIVSFGFINSPKKGTSDQPWHLDYGRQVSNLFVPLHELTIHNSTQFIRGPLSLLTPMPESNNFLQGPTEIMKSEGKKFLEVTQLICKPFMILKLHCGIVHRGKQQLCLKIFNLSVTNIPGPKSFLRSSEE